MWVDEAHDRVEEERLRLDGVEAWLAELESRRREVDQLSAEVERTEAGIEEAKTNLGSKSAY
jgi:hypothetical protein